MKPKHLLLMAIVGMAATSCQTPSSSGSNQNPASGESFVSPQPDSSTEDSTGDSTPSTPVRTVSNAISSAVYRGSQVKSGTISKVEGEDTTTIAYEFGTDSYGNFLHYNVKEGSTDNDYYVTEDDQGNEVIFSVDSSNEIDVPYNLLDGYDFNGYVFNQIIDYDTYHRGVEDLVYSLYTYGLANRNRDFKEESDGETFSYSFGAGNTWSFSIIEVSFKLSDTSAFSEVSVKKNGYASNQIIENVATGVIQVIAGQTPSEVTTYTINQVEGTRDATNPHDVETFFYTAFDLSKEGSGNAVFDIESTLEMEASESAEFSIINALPTTVIPDIDGITVNVYDEGITASYNSYSGKITIRAEEVGEYNVYINSRDVSKTLTVKVNPATAKSLAVIIMKQGLNDSNGAPNYNNSYTYVGTSPVELYAGGEVLLSPSINPNIVEDTIEFEVVGGDTSDITVTNKTIRQNDSDKEVISVTSDVIGSYKVKVWPTHAEAIYVEVDINVVEKPTFASLLDGVYANKRGNNISNQVTFTPDSFTSPATDSMTGQATIKNASGTEEATYVITDSATQTGAYNVTFTHVSGSELDASVKIGPDYSVAIYYGTSTSGTTLTKATPEFLYSGQYEAEHNETFYSFTLQVGGIFMLSRYGDNYESIEGSYSLSVRGEGGYNINFIANSYTTAGQTLLNFDDDTSYIDPTDGSAYVNIMVGGVSTTIKFVLSAE